MKDIAKIEQLVFKQFEKLKLFEKKNLVIGLSGGPDSTFLTILLTKFINNKPGEKKPAIKAVYFNHGETDITMPPDVEIALCKKLCDTINIPFQSIPIELKKTKEGYEAYGRQLRIETYIELSKKEHIDHVLLGHHKDDHIETVFYQFLRGAGLGSKGIKEKDGFFARPLINITKEDILFYLSETKTDYISDTCNLDNNYTRNFLRNKLFPILKSHWPDYRERLTFAGKKMEENYYLLDCLAKNDYLTISNNTIKLLTTDPIRTKNAFKFFLKEQKISTKDSVLEEISKIASMQKKSHTVDFENFKLTKYKQGTDVLYTMEKIQPIIKPKSTKL